MSCYFGRINRHVSEPDSCGSLDSLTCFPNFRKRHDVADNTVLYAKIRFIPHFAPPPHLIHAPSAKSIKSTHIGYRKINLRASSFFRSNFIPAWCPKIWYFVATLHGVGILKIFRKKHDANQISCLEFEFVHLCTYVHIGLKYFLEISNNVIFKIRQK